MKAFIKKDKFIALLLFVLLLCSGCAANGTALSDIVAMENQQITVLGTEDSPESAIATAEAAGYTVTEIPSNSEMMPYDKVRAELSEDVQGYQGFRWLIEHYYLDGEYVKTVVRASREDVPSEEIPELVEKTVEYLDKLCKWDEVFSSGQEDVAALQIAGQDSKMLIQYYQTEGGQIAVSFSHQSAADFVNPPDYDSIFWIDMTISNAS